MSPGGTLSFMVTDQEWGPFFFGDNIVFPRAVGAAGVGAELGHF